MRKPFEDLWEVMETRRQPLEVGDVPSIYHPEHLRQSARRARGCPDTEALCGWVDGQLRRRNLRRWLTVWHHIRLHGCRECQKEVAMIATVVRPTGEARSSDQQWSRGREHAPKRRVSSSVPVKGPLAWVSGVSVVAVALSFWLLSQHVGKERPQPPSEQALSSQAVGPIIWGD
jgi:hypothetical protein